MGERDDARHQVDEKRERVSRIAHEVSRRLTPEYAKERARDMARDRAPPFSRTDAGDWPESAIFRRE